MNVIKSLMMLTGLAGGAGWLAAANAEEVMIVPHVVEPWWQVAGDPDLGEWTSEGQQPVDFGIWQARDGTWQLWSCIRKTKCGGSTRLFYRWQGERLTDADWQPMGIAMIADPEYGETLGGLQAPHVITHDDVYYMFYGDWRNICLASSRDGKEFPRVLDAKRRPQLFTEDRHPDDFTNTRDAMVLRVGDRWYCYYTAFPDRKGAVYCRTSTDLRNWGPSTIVSAGGSAGGDATSAECPHVVYHEPSGHFYLFRTQRYGRNGRSSIYRSKDPLRFGVDDDRYLVCRLPVAAPELIQHEGQWYVASLLPSLKGIRIARLEWRPDEDWAPPGQPRGEPVFDFESARDRAMWKRVEGDIEPVFTTSARSDFSPPRRYFIGTAESGRRPGVPDDAQTGVVESPEFVIETGRYFAWVSGGGDRDSTFVAIVDVGSGDELVRYTGSGESNQLEEVAVDLRRLRGRRARIRIVDRATGSWGHINFGGLYRDEE